MGRMYIRIDKRPAGAAPEEIRDDWVGAQIPLMEPPERPFDFVVAVGGGPADPQNMDGYDVTIEDAITALRVMGRNRSADWWEQQEAYGVEHLRFGKVFCTQFDAENL